MYMHTQYVTLYSIKNGTNRDMFNELLLTLSVILQVNSVLVILVDGGENI